MEPLRYTFTINLTQGQQALVDERDWYELRKHRWHARWNSHTRSYYASRMVRLPNGKQETVRMHRQILGLERGDRRQVDHENHNTLDNRRRNIKVCTHRENNENRRHNSPYGVGVSKDKRTARNPFRARARSGGKQHHLGCFATAAEAREARRRFLEEHDGP